MFVVRHMVTCERFLTLLGELYYLCVQMHDVLHPYDRHFAQFCADYTKFRVFTDRYAGGQQVLWQLLLEPKPFFAAQKKAFDVAWWDNLMGSYNMNTEKEVVRALKEVAELLFHWQEIGDSVWNKVKCTTDASLRLFSEILFGINLVRHWYPPFVPAKCSIARSAEIEAAFFQFDTPTRIVENDGCFLRSISTLLSRTVKAVDDHLLDVVEKKYTSYQRWERPSRYNRWLADLAAVEFSINLDVYKWDAGAKCFVLFCQHPTSNLCCPIRGKLFLQASEFVNPLVEYQIVNKAIKLNCDDDTSDVESPAVPLAAAPEAPSTVPLSQLSCTQ